MRAAVTLMTMLLFSRALFAAAVGDAPSQPPAPEPSVTSAEMPASDVRPLTREDLEAWLDGFMPYALATGDVAGAVVVVVKDGATLLQKGYGYADVEARQPVDPATTLFRPGSISKLTTWTAVMQLVEQGKLDLDADVNGYLDFEIPARDGQPITLRNILTHTPGFEERVKDLIIPEGAPFDPLDVYLKEWVPARIFAPGTTPAYSNYATSLAGYIVARTAGLSYDDYVDRHILQPLGMEHSTFRQPLPERLQPFMAKGYARASEGKAKPFEVVVSAPAGSQASSGADMARFMIAHLQKGAFGDNRILKEETAEQMHATALTVLPRVDRMMLGFYEQNRNGRRIISHAGDTAWFHSDLFLFLDDNVGLFLSLNSAGKEGAAGKIRKAVFEQFADRYLPGPTFDGKVDPQTAAEHARMITGLYQVSRRMETNFLRVLGLASPVKVFPNEDGTISVSLATNVAGAPIKWREVEPFVWRDVDGESFLSAKVEDGRVTRFGFEWVSPFMVFEPVPASISPAWVTPALVAGLIALLFTALAWPISALTRRHYGASYSLSGRDAQAHRWIRVASSAVIALFVLWGVVVSLVMGDQLLSSTGDVLLMIVQLLSAIVFFGAAAIGVWNAMVVVRGERKWYAKAWAVLLALALLVVLWVALAFHLIAFDVNY
ncbi:serine hydrolase domain-containing protein [Steroidobacter agaridevorans]|uniref:serine hydrolase domain-containing protein n=1 Tax=Steroidobacter agaridevorans TaxID=2695856 RepID=UPI00132CAB94|nr:serine hydrolase domain-containing protein [Steroidobacter agaridevorans]GFE87032.1 FmtA-like protein [Steroidobacter agaridevorans]